MVTFAVKYVKKRLGFITKVQGWVTSLEHLLLNHPPFMDKYINRYMDRSIGQYIDI